jgi:hypothetical protein
MGVLHRPVAEGAPLTSPPSYQDDGGGGHTAAPAPVDRYDATPGRCRAAKRPTHRRAVMTS